MFSVHVVVGAINGRSCPWGKGVCVQNRYCRRTTRHTHKCVLENGKHGICCDRDQITLGKTCTTSTRVSGLCMAEDQCGGYTRDFLLGIVNDDSWRRWSNVCYEEGQSVCDANDMSVLESRGVFLYLH